MSLEQNKAFVKKYIEELDTFQGPNPDMITDDFQVVVSAGEPFDAETYRGYAKDYYKSIPDNTHKTKAIYAEGDTVIAYITAGGTHKGELWGIPGTNKYVQDDAIAIFTLRGGKIARQQMIVDNLGMMEQIAHVRLEPLG
ncbi:MAG: ester cyclase [Chloroflexi bacterium]|nr:ester cyclase [Chloroflexota bacterium]